MVLALASLEAFGRGRYSTAMPCAAWRCACPFCSAGVDETHELRKPGRISTRYLVESGASSVVFPAVFRYCEQSPHLPPSGFSRPRTEQKMSAKMDEPSLPEGVSMSTRMRPSERKLPPVAVVP